jgi:hypothetical protein
MTSAAAEISALAEEIRGALSSQGKPAAAAMHKLICAPMGYRDSFSRGTGSSNPSPSSGESDEMADTPPTCWVKPRRYPHTATRLLVVVVKGILAHLHCQPDFV